MQENVLKRNGLKNTENRKLILEVLEETHEPMTADEIFTYTRQHHELNFSTVYRTLSTLTEKGITLKNVGGDGKAYFQINNSNHSHYMVCKECRKRIPIDGCPLKEMADKLGKNTGFHITGHNLEFIGECPECWKEKHKNSFEY